MLLFLAAQVVGLYLLNLSIETIKTDDTGKISVTYTEPITGRPELEGKDSFIYTFGMILGGTIILLTLMKFKLYKVWKVWFFLAIFGALSVSFSTVLDIIPSLIIALIFTYLKVFRPNIYIHNLTEVFIYGGITIMLAPIFTIFWAVMLLIMISIYDMIAVWKLKHMITLATEQADQKMFAGLLIPYSVKAEKRTDLKMSKNEEKIMKEIPKGIKENDVKSAILGGGDIAFPMIFAGSAMTHFIILGISSNIAYFLSLVVSLFAGIALFLLLLKSEKNKFYPAMPFISAGCFIGYAFAIGIIVLFRLISLQQLRIL
jgi:presenilin-like A22 family membrane protease